MKNPQFMSWGFLIIMFALLYFFMIVPQKKQKKTREAMLTALQVGDKVITIGGIYGTVTNIKDDRVFLEIAEKVEIKIRKTAVSAQQPTAAAAPAKVEESESLD